MIPSNTTKILKILLGIYSLLNSFSAFGQYARQDCTAEINRMREIYIIILRKIPAMPPLANLSSGIQRALNDAENNRESGDFKSCIVNLKSQTAIVEKYAR